MGWFFAGLISGGFVTIIIMCMCFVACELKGKNEDE